MSGVAVIGVGNRYRRDDGFGPAVLDALVARGVTGLAFHESDGEPTRMIDSWDGADLAIVVETIRHDAVPGSVISVDVRSPAIADGARGPGMAGSHSLGPADAVALGELLGRVPPRIQLVGVEPADLGFGEGLSAAVQAALSRVVDEVLALARTASVTS